MKIMVINPNTSSSMTEHLRKVLEERKRPDTQLSVVNPEHGPLTIESAFEESWATVNMLGLVKKANQDGFDGIIIACFSDPGLRASREISDIPVFGIMETSLHIACMLGSRFTIITNRRERVPHKVQQVHELGLGNFLASVRPLNLSVQETDSNPQVAKRRIMEVSRSAVEEDGAEVIVLGCAGMAGYEEEIEKELKVAVLDPSTVTLKFAEALAEIGLRHSKLGLFARPPEKEFK
ncbi:MAG: aspartate/glutamate racemase family protein [Caldiserica bacterium]|jgi:allantoin racemase|nr:aspartate/glutamate racemase family protein [Caldisericota bacterium]MDH7562356.1 aspartate/glutamate racemase family protein [Caldisericota bacterium]